ncbi:alpha-amylase [Aerococcaceae bacterium zg-B36]|uniref:alpha-amylase family glycosyl hydrolase n=1 Tax=Aerococcaceae bacterium zg-252 TaxID=2796928 RepID=UPI001BD7FFE4|nr:alpha-amylase [Aerococcaceae bacterium zg-B36]
MSIQPNQVIYSIFVRNFSPEGTFRGVIPQLPRIKELGVDIIWLLPIHPLGEENRKGKAGSPYANKDYRGINPEYGTLEDFKALCQAIHDNGMKVMIDVVYNHTSPDSVLVQEHPEWFFYRPDGKRGNQVGDWTDIVDLDYKNNALWDYQIESLTYWAEFVDGFRCDVAPLVPIEFWKEARKAVAKVKDEFIWLSESVEFSFIKLLRQAGGTAHSDCEMYQAFDVLYDYDVHYLFHGYLRGKNTLSEYINRLNLQEVIYPKHYIKARHLENHDNPRAKFLIPEEQNLLQWTAFQYFEKGFVLLYNGQEVQESTEQTLFDVDPVNWQAGRDISAEIRRLHDIKKQYIPVDSSARYELTAYDELDAVVIEHESNETLFVAVCSFKGKEGQVKVPLTDGQYTDLVSGDTIEVVNGQVALVDHALAVSVEK